MYKPMVMCTTLMNPTFKVGMTISRYRRRGSIENKSLHTQVILDFGGVFEVTPSHDSRESTSYMRALLMAFRPEAAHSVQILVRWAG